MNKSFSKIRHIQEANALLEKRTLNEQDNTVAVGQADTVQPQNQSVAPTDPNAVGPTTQPTQLPFCSAKLGEALVPGQKIRTGASKQVELPGGKVTITYNGTVSPENRGFTVNVDGNPFCFIKG
jgi:hypothetical protein